MEYRWSARNFISCTDCAAPAAYPPFTAEYTVEVVAAGGCSVSKTFSIEVMNNRRMYIPTAFSPNGDDQNDRWRIYTGPRYRRPKPAGTAATPRARSLRSGRTSIPPPFGLPTERRKSSAERLP